MGGPFDPSIMAKETSLRVLRVLWPAHDDRIAVKQRQQK